MSESDRDGQVEELWCGEGRSITQCRTPSAKVSEQSGREFTSGNEVARACHETIQVTGPRAAFSLGLRNYFLALPSGRHLYRARGYHDVMKSRFVLWTVAIGNRTAAS